jgi:KDO2-lipid IV(A) lauroyltransferase
MPKLYGGFGKLAHTVLYGMVTGVLWGLALLPLRLAYWLGARCGDLTYVLLASRRRVTLENLALAFGEDKSTAAQQAIARATFRNLGKHLVDFSRLRHFTPEAFPRLCTVEGLDQALALLQRGRGLLIISAHFGSWELAPAIAAYLGMPVWVIVRPLDNAVLDQVVEDYRQRCGYRIIPKRQALAQSLQALRQGAAVAVLMDQSSLRREGMAVEFFGIKAYTSKGPALLALRAQCPVIGAFLVREAPGRHRLVLTPEIPVQRTGNTSRDLEENTRAFNRVIEAYIRRYPDPWFWLHRRWKHRPTGQAPPGAAP